MIDVIVTCYNQEKFIKKCLDSINQQTYKKFYLYIVDDCSQDGSYKQIATISYNFHEPNLLDNPLIRQNKENYGQVTSTNQAIIETGNRHNKYIVWMGIDNWLDPSFLQVMRTYLDEGYDFVYSDFYVVNNDDRIIGIIRKPDASIHALYPHYNIGVSFMYRRELHDKFGLLDDEFKHAGDYELFWRFWKGGAKFKHIPIPLYYWRNHEYDWDDLKRKNIESEINIIRKDIEQWAEKNGQLL